MTVFLAMAWRNVLRNYRRSAITIAAIAVGLAAMIFLWGFVDGTIQQSIDNFIRIYSGHIQVMAPGFQRTRNLEDSLRVDDQRLAKAAARQPAIEAVSPRIEQFGLASATERSAGVLVIGVDPVRESSVTRLAQFVAQGAWLQAGDDHAIVIGEDLADTLQVRLGEKLVLMTQAADGGLGASAYRVTGLLKSGAEELDRQVAFITVAAAQDLFALKGKVSKWVVRTRSADAAAAVMAALSRELDPAHYDVLAWNDLNPHMFQWFDFDIAFMTVILFVVLLVVAIGILNTVLMGVLERTREFGLMMALGTKPHQLVATVLLEACCLTCIGIGLGFALGVAGVWYFGRVGIRIPNMELAMSHVFGSDLVYTVISVRHLLSSISVIVVTSLAVSLYPAWRATRLEPVEAIRHI